MADSHRAVFQSYRIWRVERPRVFDAAMIDEVMDGIADRQGAWHVRWCHLRLYGFCMTSALAISARGGAGACGESARRIYCCDPVIGDVGQRYICAAWSFPNSCGMTRFLLRISLHRTSSSWTIWRAAASITLEDAMNNICIADGSVGQRQVVLVTSLITP